MIRQATRKVYVNDLEQRDERVVELHTWIRKKDDKGVWRFWHLIETEASEKDMDVVVHNCYQRLIKEAYNVLVLGCLNKEMINLKDHFGLQMFSEDPDQRDEEERLKRAIITAG